MADTCQNAIVLIIELCMSYTKLGNLLHIFRHSEAGKLQFLGIVNLKKKLSSGGKKLKENLFSLVGVGVERESLGFEVSMKIQANNSPIFSLLLSLNCPPTVSMNVWFT